MIPAKKETRVIKFRGLGVNDRKWYYGSIRIRAGYDYLIIEDEKGVGHDVEAKTVSQFTGIKDVNNKEIFEDDIIRFFGAEYWVTWSMGDAAFYLEPLDDSYSQSLFGPGEKEILGNIYEIK